LVVLVVGFAVVVVGLVVVVVLIEVVDVAALEVLVVPPVPGRH
jgi:hypothetical protein